MEIWSALSLVSGAMMSLFLMLPPMFWGVAAYTAPRKDPEVTTLMHELASLTMTTTDQFYIFLWIGVTVIALRPATQLVKNNPFPRWWGYTSLWISIMFEAGAIASYRVAAVCLEWAAGVLVAADFVLGVDHDSELVGFPRAACPAS